MKITLYIFIIFIFITYIFSRIEFKYKAKYVWDKSSAKYPECNENITLVRIKNSLSNYSMYIRVEEDVISNKIRINGDWEDCPKIRMLWHILPGLNKDDYYMDAGANIGICSLGMLDIGIKTISIEPIPNNLFIFTSSLLHNYKWINNITLFTVGLGNKDETKKINIVKGNWGGSSFIDLHQNFKKKTIHITKLDNLLSNFNYKIHLASVDIQGYELYMLQGSKKILRKKIIRHFFMEIWCPAILKINISEFDIYNLFEQYGYKIKEKIECKNRENSYFDIIASLNNY